MTSKGLLGFCYMEVAEKKTCLVYVCRNSLLHIQEIYHIVFTVFYVRMFFCQLFLDICRGHYNLYVDLLAKNSWFCTEVLQCRFRGQKAWEKRWVPSVGRSTSMFHRYHMLLCWKKHLQMILVHKPRSPWSPNVEVISLLYVCCFYSKRPTAFFWKTTTTSKVDT